MNHLQECRKSKNISQKYLASQLGVTVQTISYWENGVRFPSRENLQKIAKIFNVPSSYLLGDDESTQLKKEIPAVADEYSETEIKLINDFRRCNSANQLRVLAFAEGAADSQ